jgi:cobalt-precorrin-5B (C1)-methyltransferase
MTVREVTIDLPAGIPATFRLSGQNYSRDAASCFVVKDAGDDPDVTNGAEVHATILLKVPGLTHGMSPVSSGIIITGGIGIGRVTKPGLAVPPGEWAINPVPHRMIEQAVREVFPLRESPVVPQVIISIPDGEERAKKTLNARLGIIGGLSILGTTGIVRPVSAKAWTDTIDAALDVAKACDCETVVLSTGRSSELAGQKFLNRTYDNIRKTSGLFDPLPAAVSSETRFVSRTLPEEGFIMMGDHIAYALQACHKRGYMRPIIACQFAKLLKISCGHENTHAAASELDLSRLLEWARDSGLQQSLLDSIAQANTAREIALTCCFDPALLELVFQHARLVATRHAPGVAPRFLVADYSGNCVFSSP